MVNKAPRVCYLCGGMVPTNGGILTKSGKCAHPTCFRARRPQVTEVRFADGTRFSQNFKGRCEDAPCCGCCS